MLLHVIKYHKFDCIGVLVGKKEGSSIANRKTRHCEKTIGCTYTYQFTSHYAKHNCKTWADKQKWSKFVIYDKPQITDAVMNEEEREYAHVIEDIPQIPA